MHTVPVDRDRAPNGRRPVLVLGLPRSGTTWTAHILASAPGSVAVLEPDNEKTSVSALAPKRGLGRFPVIGPGEEAAGYRELWAWALAGGRAGPGVRLGGRLFAGAGAGEREAAVLGHPSARLRLAGRLARPPRIRSARVDHVTRPDAPPSRGSAVEGAGAVRVVAKSVHACLAAEWLADTFPVDVVVVLRHPANVLASWLELDLPDRDRGLERLPAVVDRFLRRWGVPPPGPEPLERAVWQLGLLTAALEEAAVRHPGWLVRTHETLCDDPPRQFRHLYEALGLEWSSAVEGEIARGDRPGRGFDLQRRARDAADAWRTRLGPRELATLRGVLAAFPLQHWSVDDLPRDAGAR